MAALTGLFAAAVCVVATPLVDDAAALKRYAFSRVEMAAAINIVLYAPDETVAAQAAEAAYYRFRSLNRVLSDYDSESEVRRLCDTSAAGRPVAVSDDLWRVLSRAKEISERSNGAFDVTVGPVVRLWRRARRQGELPDPERLNEARRGVGFCYVKLHPESRRVELLREAMRIDLGGIAMGYAVDEAMKVIREHGITRFVIDGSGDVGAGDPPPGSPGWVVGIPGLDEAAAPVACVYLANRSLTTSGDTVQFVVIEGRRYSHIVDPRTGIALTDHSCVTVVAADTMTADALASAVSVLGVEKGLELVEATPGAAALVQRAPGGEYERHESRRWAELPKAQAKETVKSSP